MDPAHFTASDFGAAVREPGNKWAFWYFKPATVPRAIVLTSSTIKALSDADAALGRLQGPRASFEITRLGWLTNRQPGHGDLRAAIAV